MHCQHTNPTAALARLLAPSRPILLATALGLTLAACAGTVADCQSPQAECWGPGIEGGEPGTSGGGDAGPGDSTDAKKRHFAFQEVQEDLAQYAEIVLDQDHDSRQAIRDFAIQ